MAIFRGAGGSGDAVADTSNESVTAIAAAAAALASQTAAATSASSAATSATSATNSASSATTSASNASSSASSASSSASSASTSASNAATSETNAATSASNAATSETNAAASAATAASFTPSQTGNAGKYLTTDGTSTSWGTVVGGSGTVTSVTGTAPVSVATGTTTPVISIPAATTSVNGYLTSTDWTTFNSKQAALGFTPYNATNPSGYTSNTGTVTSVAATAGTGISISGSPITSSGTFNIINTAPDQVVSLTGAGTTTVTGTYPNFTITSTGGGGSGTVTSVAMMVPTGLSISGSPITTSGTLGITYAAGYAIPTTASQTNWDSAYTQRLQWDGGATNLVAATGRTSLGLGSISTQASSSVSITGGSITGITDITVADGGTGASTAANARINLLPTYTGNGGKVLAVNTGATDVEWITASGGGGSGTVTSVAMSVPTFLSVSGSPITTSGTLGLSLSGSALPTSSGGTGLTTIGTANQALVVNGAGTGLTYVTLGGGTGTVTSASVVSANGFSGTVANATTTPAITLQTTITGLLKGNGAAISSAIAGTDYQSAQSVTGIVKSSGTTRSAATAGTDYSVGTASLATGIIKSTTSTGALSIAVSGTDYAPATSGSSILYGNGSGGFSNVTVGSGLAFSAGTLSASGGGGMTYPTGTGIAVVTSGTSWGTTLTAPTGTIAGTSDTQTLTNKRITPRVSTTTSSATPTINTDNVDFYGLTAQAVDITSFTTNLTGTPTDGQKLWIYIVGTAARAITWGASFESSTATLPTTTVTTNRLDVGFVWNTATSKWRCVAVA